MSEPSDDEGYRHWVVPVSEGAEYVPNAANVAHVVDSLETAGWIKGGPRPPYNSDLPFYFSIFPGPTDEAEALRGDDRFDLSASSESVIRRSHCRDVTVMVTDIVLVAPTARAHSTVVRCTVCGEPLLPAPEPRKSRAVPPDCPECGAVVTLRDFGSLPLFRFAVILELRYPPPAGTALSVAPDLLALLKDHTGHSFRGEAE